MDSSPIHLLTTASLRAVRAQRPDLDWQTRRFRPEPPDRCAGRRAGGGCLDWPPVLGRVGGTRDREGLRSMRDDHPDPTRGRRAAARRAQASFPMLPMATLGFWAGWCVPGRSFSMTRSPLDSSARSDPAGTGAGGSWRRSSAGQRRRQTAPGVKGGRGRVAAEDLDADVIGAGVEVGLHPGRDGRFVAPGHDGIDEPVAAGRLEVFVACSRGPAGCWCSWAAGGTADRSAAPLPGPRSGRSPAAPLVPAPAAGPARGPPAPRRCARAARSTDASRSARSRASSSMRRRRAASTRSPAGCPAASSWSR